MMRLLAESESSIGQAYNIGNQEPEVTMKRLGELILLVTGKQYSIEEKEVTAGSPPRRCPNMQKTTACTDYMPKVSLEEGIRRTFDWYRTHIFNGSEMGAK